ncbi:putative glycolipid-binding domain-containing protein [Yoonia maricola]|nr:putative glycolipid-binding domain-containing protein [Yoonia maricola]
MWRRIDVIGLETCALGPSDDGYKMAGAALFADTEKPLRLEYEVHCNDTWECTKAMVKKWRGINATTLCLERTIDGQWSADGQTIRNVDGLVDIDLGFTPATNTNAIKRLGLNVGDQQEFTAVWLDERTWAFKPLRQRYERLSNNKYRYVSVESGYEAQLEVDDFGLVRTYPDLWQAVI